jgi:hypothetical protein
MCMTLEQYERQLLIALLHYGFTSNPISDDVESLYADNVSIDDAYAIACDVAAGFTIAESRAAMARAA